jgi:predicted transcriptional regulator with HTH domain
VSFIKENIVILFDSVDGMQRETQEEQSLDMRRPLVVRALRRSNVRKKIAEYLFDISPSCSYTSEIAYNVKTTPTNVIGALRGMGSRYKEDESLLSLELVEEKSGGKNIRLYGLTTFGREVIEKLQRK